MNEEIIKILEESDATPTVKIQALTIAMEVSGNIAYRNASMAAGGQFLALLMELMKLLLPILLELLKPKA